MLPYGQSELQLTCGYHPDGADLTALVGLLDNPRLLVVDGAVPDVHERVAELRVLADHELELPVGLYWFDSGEGVEVLAVTGGGPPASGERMPSASLTEDQPLSWARDWFAHLWPDATVVTAPRFAVNDDVVLKATGRDYTVKSRTHNGAGWMYGMRVEGRMTYHSEQSLDPFSLADDPWTWITGAVDDVRRFSATLTRAKLAGMFTDTLFSFRATRTLFRPYQFKPVIKMLETGKSRILVADEVGLGKTIEAGLIWTELEARSEADRVLVVCPASLVTKWRREMEDRFGFELTELSGDTLKEFERKALENRLPRRFAHIISIQRLRTWEAFEDVVAVGDPLGLAIVDEAHMMRNAPTRNYQAGALLSEWVKSLVLLTATPINLRNEDLFNLLELLTPGEFGTGEALEQQLAPNVVLNKVARTLTNPAVAPDERLDLLAELGRTRYGAPIMARRPEVPLLQDLLSKVPLSPRDIVDARRYLADLGVLSSVLTRTRRVEVDEEKAVREAQDVEVPWTAHEQAFYAEYVAWCRRRADLAGVPVGFAMQMPLRLASACLPVARHDVVRWSAAAGEPTDEDDGFSAADDQRRSIPALRPHDELVAAARALGSADSKYPLLEARLGPLVDSGRQALVFSFSRPTLGYLEHRLSQRWRVAVLHGGVPKERRNEIMADFRAGLYDIVLANRVASEGLDFEFCSVVANYDLPWNPMEVEQRIGRIDRIGQQEEKISILNVWCPAALDESIKMRLLQRIGVFEGTIGPLEPIISEHLSDFRDAVFDFSLSDDERRRRADEALAAIEAQQAGLEDVSSAAPFLLAAAEAEVAGMEEELLATGRYVGAAELAHLVEDWATLSGGTAAVEDGRSMRLRGTPEMATRLDQLTRSGRLRNVEAERYRTGFLNEEELHLTLDHELARTSQTADLLSARHPVVLGATLVPEQRAARFAHVSVTSAAPEVPEGTYVVVLSTATWRSIRPGQELWGEAVRLGDGKSEPAVVDALLAALARGELENGRRVRPTGIEPHLDSALNRMLTRHSTEETRRVGEATALLEARRLTLEDQYERAVGAMQRRLDTSVERKSHRGVRMFSRQIERTRANHRRTLDEIDAKPLPHITLLHLAVCVLEVGRATV